MEFECINHHGQDLERQVAIHASVGDPLTLFNVPLRHDRFAQMGMVQAYTSCMNVCPALSFFKNMVSPLVDFLRISIACEYHARNAITVRLNDDSL